MTEEYRNALEDSREASKEFRVAQEQYRARTIGDAEFLAARAKYREAEALFDAAYAKEEALDLD
jgi:membrane-bound lytic murein transglycosylase B